MKRRATLFLAILLGTIAPSAPALATGVTTPPGALTTAVDQFLADPALAGAQTGVVVADARTGDFLVDRRGNERLLPASNVKLLTSAAAMSLLGPGHRFVTTVSTDGPRHGRVLDGDLYLRGSGDPALTPASLDALARDVAATGVRRITGDLAGDDTAFDDVRLGLEWAWDDESFAGAAPVSALTLSPDSDLLAGTVTVTVSAALSGRPAVRLTPPTSLLKVVNHAVTGAGPSTIEVTRRHGTSTLLVTGSLAANAPSNSASVTVSDPTLLTTEVFRSALRRHGVQLEGRTRTAKTAPPPGRELARHAGPALRTLMAPLLKLSNNNMAELLVKAIGGGSWEAGTAAVAGYLDRLGIDPATLRQVDGSGLSRRNLIPPAALTRLLLGVRQEPWFGTWFAALPVAGNPDPLIGGTLRNRMLGTPAAGVVHAKTGTLTGVTALSGYVDGDRPLVFSVIVNNQLAPSVTTVIDRLVVSLTQSSQSGAAPASARWRTANTV
ncbi:D-alanyl-D-alanine carboxypeptidase/D-alanyl-D-alanine endopeptidase [Paractinoplanes atraurantiacus]|uniref:D-alanyl-D-alanine carboxypeptidase / D-alanyl-D-alanine-endopeptidase (Penicillin-binding protein 4) n=1 Tax=Paractinoplanes atraurantiacus TaxID=1036182 RepID=A0A285KFA8_9ACTN|nr:D-alanyl-D-alanine carboxypeptidase/D-alanyl-D-alanine-endopeptidase [Actinoplanes atraurantiacus]SNY71304.1 D-alanyl-D-alanine carboxypeptidase / D-alanyl-D-alanine-endopeptidase (penicillin-binding protein 4) [Actinoplanes atraurantiacus]